MDWQNVYKQLHAAGMTDKEISEVAGCARETINLVRNGNYPFGHRPGFENAKKLQKLIKSKTRGLGADPAAETN